MKPKFLLLIVFSAIIFTGLIGAIFLFKIPMISAVDYYTSGVNFSSEWNTSKAGSNDTTIILPIYSTGSYNFTVWWGDGTQQNITNYVYNNHTYASPGVYTINISGTIQKFRFNNAGDKLKITKIMSWGDLKIGNDGNTFFGCSNLDSNATDAPNLTGVTSLANMFYLATSWRGVSTLPNWNTTGVTAMDSMFRAIASFNGNISNWDVSSVTNMADMLSGCALFNQNLSNWNVSKVTNMNNLFYNNGLMNYDLSRWDVGNVTTMSGMFQSATKFNQNLSNWNVSKVTNMNNMFNGTNLSISNYDSLLNGWGSRIETNNVTLMMGNIKYSPSGTDGRNNLINLYNWTILDGGNINIINSNFSTSKGIIRNDFYGTNGMMRYIYNYGDGKYSEWNTNNILNAKFTSQRIDASLNGIYTGISNRGFEQFNLTTKHYTSADQYTEVPFGWWLVTLSGGQLNATISTDKYEGNKAINLTNNGTGQVYLFRAMDLPVEGVGKKYNITIMVKSNNIINVKFNKLNGAGTFCSVNSNGSGIWQKLNCNFTFDGLYSDFFSIYIDAGETALIDDIHMYEDNIEKFFFLGGSTGYTNMINLSNEIKLASSYGIKTNIMLGYMPWVLANYSENCSTFAQSCPPYNDTLYGDLLVDYISRLETLGVNLSDIEATIWNEAYINGVGASMFMSDLGAWDSLVSANRFVNLWNESKNQLKKSYPTLEIGGTSLFRDAPNMMNTFISNLTGWDYLEIHPYTDSGSANYYYKTDQLIDDIDEIFTKCTTYNKTCNKIALTEWNEVDSTFRNDNYTSNEYIMDMVYSYVSILAKYPTNISSYLYTWEDSTWGIVNRTASRYFYAYNATKDVAHLCPSGATVYVTSNDDSSIKQVSCKKGNMYSLIVINTDTNAKNITVNMTNNTNSKMFPYTSIMNYETGASIPVSTQGIIQLGMLQPYDVLYLTMGESPTITSIQPANLTTNTTSSVNFSANLTDDMGLTNSTLNIMNTSDNSLITNFVEYVAGEISIIESWVVNLADGVYKWWISVWDDEGKETVTGNYTLTVDTEAPTISLVSPTTTSTNLSQSNIYLNVTTQDTFNHSVLSNIGLKLWLRYNNESGENNTFALDYSGYGNNVTGIGGTTSNSSGKFDDCIKLNGTSYFKSTNDSSLNITDAITVSTWIKLDSYASYRRVLVKSHTSNAYPYTTYGLLLDSSTGGFSRIRMEMASGGYQHLIRSTSNLTNGQWYLVTATYNGSDNSAKIYINGVLDNSSLIKSFANLTEVPVSNLYNGKIDTNINYVTVGISSYLGDGMNGSLDDSIIYDRALSLNEIQAYYNATRLDHNITNLADGNYNVTAYAQDTSGNINSTSRWVTLDTTPPVITITNPTTADENSNPVNLRVTTNEVSTCAYSLDSQANISMGTNTGFLVPITLSNGVHTIKVFCNDSLINQNTTGASISFNVYLGGGVTGGGGTDTDPIVNVTNQTIINNTTVIGNESEKFDGKIDLGDIKIGEFTIGTWALIGIIVGILFLILLAFIIDAIRKK